MISLRSFLPLEITGAAHGGAEESGDVTMSRFSCSAKARDSVGDSVSKAFRDEDICSSRKFRFSSDSASVKLAPRAGESGYDRFSSITRIAALPFTDSPGERVASSSI